MVAPGAASRQRDRRRWGTLSGDTPGGTLTSTIRLAMASAGFAGADSTRPFMRARIQLPFGRLTTGVPTPTCVSPGSGSLKRMPTAGKIKDCTRQIPLRSRGTTHARLNWKTRSLRRGGCGSSVAEDASRAHSKVRPRRVAVGMESVLADMSSGELHPVRAGAGRRRDDGAQ